MTGHTYNLTPVVLRILRALEVARVEHPDVLLIDLNAVDELEAAAFSDYFAELHLALVEQNASTLSPLDDDYPFADDDYTSADNDDDYPFADKD